MTISMTATIKTQAGKGASRALRREGRIPAIIYGKNKENISISLADFDIKKYYNKANFGALIMDIDVDGTTYQVLPKALQRHPVTDAAEHIDFLHVSEDVQVRVVVHIHFTNEDKCIGLKRGGVLNIVSRDLELLCNPSAIPHHIEVDIANLNISDSIHLADIKLPQGVKALSNDVNATIATVVGRVKEDTDAKGGSAQGNK